LVPSKKEEKNKVENQARAMQLAGNVSEPLLLARFKSNANDKR
jgi:hypothetical protein